MNFTSILEENAQVGVFPNPTSGSVVVNLSEKLVGADITVIDLYGKRVLSLGVQQTAHHQYELTEIGAGMYFLNVENENGVEAIRFIVQ